MPAHQGLHYNFIPHTDQPVVLFLHGFLGSSDDWQQITNRINDSYGILTVDLPGHGRSLSENADNYLIENCAGNIVSLLDYLNLERVILVGYSMGGRLGLYLLTHFQNRFYQAVIESSSPGLKTETERENRSAHDKSLAAKLTKTDLSSWLNQWYAQPLFASLREKPELFKRTITSRMNNDPTGLALSLEMMTVGRQQNLWPKLNEINRPLLLIAGELDSKYTKIIQQTADLCPNAQPVIIENSGHNVHSEQPERYLEELTRFLNKHS